MDNYGQDPSKINAVAYNQPLRDQIHSLHEMLGDELSAIVSQAIEPTKKLSHEAEKALFAMSEGASRLTIALLNIKSSKKHLSEAEQADYDGIKEVTETLGNLQVKVSKLLKLAKQISGLNLQLKEVGISLSEDMMESQRQFREIRADINDFGVFSDDPDLALYMSQQRKSLE